MNRRRVLCCLLFLSCASAAQAQLADMDQQPVVILCAGGKNVICRLSILTSAPPAVTSQIRAASPP